MPFMLKHNNPNYKHGLENTRLYRIWENMKQRCYNKNHTAYHNYGGRGIKVCDEWNSFILFHDWATSNGYGEHLTIDREDNDKGYTPENCRWTNRKAQHNNKRTNRLLTYKGKTQNCRQWSEELNIEYTNIIYRLRAGWSVEDTLSMPVNKRKKGD